MAEQDNTWVIPMTGGMALSVFGITMVETATWFVQYGALGAGLVLTVLSLHQAMSETTPE